MPPSQVRHYQSSSHKLLQLYRRYLYSLYYRYPLYCFLVSSDRDKESELDTAHMADEIYSSCSKEIQREGEIVSGKKGYRIYALNQLLPTCLAIICRKIQLRSGYITSFISYYFFAHESELLILIQRASFSLLLILLAPLDLWLPSESDN